MKIVLSLISLFFYSPSAFADQTDLSYRESQKLSYVSFGVGEIILNATLRVQSVALSAQYRKLMKNTRVAFAGQVNPIFQTSGLFGVHINAGAGYMLLGTPASEMIVIDRKDTILYQKIDASSFQLFFDASLSLLPVFGGVGTATYTGYNFALQAYFTSLPIQLTVQSTSLNLGSKSGTMISGYLGYYWGI